MDVTHQQKSTATYLGLTFSSNAKRHKRFKRLCRLAFDVAEAESDFAVPVS